MLNSFLGGLLNANVRRRRLLIDALESRTMLAGVPNKLADINLTGGPFDPQHFAPLGTTGVTVFSAKSSLGEGAELWRTDGTAAGTRRVKDINPGAAGSSPASLVNISGTIYFTANDGTRGTELWKTDGTEAGTTVVKDSIVGAGSGAPRSLLNANGTLYYVASDPGGTALWRTSASLAPTRVTTGNLDFPQGRLANVGSRVYFVSRAPANGVYSLTRTDGTTTSNTGISTFVDQPSELTSLNGRVYFVTNGTGGGAALYATNPSSDRLNYSFLGNVDAEGQGLRRLTPSGAKLFFIYAGSQFTNLMYCDTATQAVQYQAAGPYQVAADSALTPVGAGSILYAADYFPTGRELFISDGSYGSARLVTSVNQDFSDGVVASDAGFAIGSTSYFQTKVGDSRELWKTDGTTAGTVRLADLGSNGPITSFGAVGSQLLFARGPGTQLWKSNNTAAGTVAVGTTGLGGTASSMPGFDTIGSYGPTFVSTGQLVYFAADNGISGRELWVNDAYNNITSLTGDLNTGAAGSNPRELTEDGNTVYFIATTPATGAEIFRTQFLSAPTVAFEVNYGPESSDPRDLVAFNGAVYFSAKSVFGAPDGPRFLYQSWSDVRDENNERLIPSGAVLAGSQDAYVFAAPEYDPANVGLYWLGGFSSARRLMTLSPGASTTGPRIVTGPDLSDYIVADDGIHGDELWTLQGGFGPPRRVTDVNPGSGDAGIRELTAFDQQLYFTAIDPEGGRALYATDGISMWRPTATAALRDPAALAVDPNNLLFTASDPAGMRSAFRYSPQWGATPFGFSENNNTQPVKIIAAFGADNPSVVLRVVQADVVTYSLATAGQFNPVTRTTWVPYKTLATTTVGADFPEGVWDSAMSTHDFRLYFPAARAEWGTEPHALSFLMPSTTLRGDVYWDRNRNSVKDTGDVAATSASVFVDLDNDGIRDDDEPVRQTDTAGLYAIGGLDYGSYVVRPLPTTGIAQTQPTGGSGITQTVTSNARTATGGRFGLSDSVAPTVSFSYFERNAATMRLTIYFSEGMDATTFAAGDLTLINRDTGAAISMTGNTVAYNVFGRLATFTFPAFANGALPNGRYRATFRTGAATDEFGNANMAATAVDFNVLAGDANNDGKVDFADLVVLAQNYNASNKNFSQGNFDYSADGKVDFADLVLLAQSYNTDLPATTAVLASSGISTKTKARVSVAKAIAI